MYDCEVAYQIWTLYHILVKYNNGKKRFYIPYQFDRKTVNLAEKTTGDCGFMQLFNRNNEHIFR